MSPPTATTASPNTYKPNFSLPTAPARNPQPTLRRKLTRIFHPSSHTPISRTEPSSRTTSPPPPTNITCGHCHQIGLHYTGSCPLRCTYCGKRGHVEQDCAPICPACRGRGEIRKSAREQEDEEGRGMRSRPGVRCMRGVLEGVRGATDRLKRDFRERYDARLMGLSSNPKPHVMEKMLKYKARQEQLEGALEMLHFWAKRCEDIMDRMQLEERS